MTHTASFWSIKQPEFDNPDFHVSSIKVTMPYNGIVYTSTIAVNVFLNYFATLPTVDKNKWTICPEIQDRLSRMFRPIKTDIIKELVNRKNIVKTRKVAA